jgi:ribosomal protein S18 acetylase RimI-like enzyme
MENKDRKVIVRPFATASDAQAIVDLDAATFGDCPYTAEYILRLESDPGQYAWLAQESDIVVGFVSAFGTHSLAAGRWEIDALAVHPSAQGRGVGTALVARALQEGNRRAGQREDRCARQREDWCARQREDWRARQREDWRARQREDWRAGLAQARALVAVSNHASRRVFEKAGLEPAAEVNLLLYRVSGRVPRPRRPDLPAVRAARQADGPAIALLAGCDPSRAAGCLRRPDNVYLVATVGARLCGYVELLHVRTLQYEGYWVESLAVDACGLDTARRRATISALLEAAIERTKRQDALDEAGCLVPRTAVDLYEAAIAAGFISLGRYHVLAHEWSVP